MVNQVLLASIAAFIHLAGCSSMPGLSSTAGCTADVTSLSWIISNFEWRMGYVVWSYSVGVGPAPPPPPTQVYNCGEAMIRMNVTSINGNEQVIPCVEQTNDAKLANITDMEDYDAGPWGPPPPSPHWFTCDMNNQLFIFPNGTVDPWAKVADLSNSTVRIRLDPVEMTLEIAQSWVCDEEGSKEQVEITGVADLPPLACQSRSNLEPDMNFLINSPVMHGPGLNAPVTNGSVCTGPEFLVKASELRSPEDR
ncbi:hypothetical protein F4777DRAFT_471328 [Nemania sp. FL0916]|nr:hypothetical protein F4777DRAFT_471328 [Nemania sp. FL0916]